MKPMTDDEFAHMSRRIGYVEACVESARRDGHPFDEAQVRADATTALAAMKEYLIRRKTP